MHLARTTDTQLQANVRKQIIVKCYGCSQLSELGFSYVDFTKRFEMDISGMKNITTEESNDNYDEADRIFNNYNRDRQAVISFEHALHRVSINVDYICYYLKKHVI